MNSKSFSPAPPQRCYSNREPPGGVTRSKKQQVNLCSKGIAGKFTFNVKELSKSLQGGSPQGDLWPPGRTLDMAERSRADQKKKKTALAVTKGSSELSTN